MKKYISLVLVALFCCTVLVGCGSSPLQSASQNVNNYKIQMTYDAVTQTVQGAQEVEYINKTDGLLTELNFHLYPVAFSEGAVNKPVSDQSKVKAYPNGDSWGDIKIKDAKVNGKDVSPTYNGKDEDILALAIDGGLEPTEKVTVLLNWVVTIPNAYHRFGYGDNTINLGNIYPISCVRNSGGYCNHSYHYNGDPFYSDLANYDVDITYPSAFKVATTGKQINTSVNTGTSTTKIKAKGVRDFCAVLSEKFLIKTKTVKGTQVIYYYFDDENADKSLQAAVDSIETFSSMFGAYPYDTFSVVKADFVHGGMEYPQLVYISSSIEDYGEYTNVIIHETAHQWWYGVVGNNQYTEAWLDEPLAEYSTALFYDARPEYAIKYADCISNANENMNMFMAIYKDVFGDVDTSMNRALNQYETDAEYVYMIYVKGLLMYDNLAEILGQKKVIACLSNYYKNNMFKNATADDLILAFEKASKKQLRNYFLSWVEGKVIL